MSAHPEPLEKDRKIIHSKNMAGGKIICAIDNKPITKKSDLLYHHINPYPAENKVNILNIATVCKRHHKEMGALSINEYKALIEMEQFFSKDGPKRLDDVLELKNGLGKKSESLKYEINDDNDSINLNLINTNAKTVKTVKNNDLRTVTLPLSTCPSTGFKYFYIVLPVDYINNDSKLQPRPLEIKRLWELYKHLIINSQLTPSLCRLEGEKVYLFDGQHKAAAQIWAGRKEVECKIYVSPKIKTLKETNLMAHDKLRQMPFFTSVLINKWASIFTEEWKDYLKQPGKKSESGFTAFLSGRGKKRPEAINMIESNIYDSILEDESNLMVKYLEEYGSGLKRPLTVNRLKQAFFKRFIANPPLAISFEESDKLRELERENNVRLLNIIVQNTLEGMWDPDAGGKNHKFSEKIYLNNAFKSICAVIKDVISAILELLDEDERKEILLREISEKDWESIENSIEIIFSNRLWSDDSEENYNNLRMSNETLIRKYFSQRGISTSWVLNNSFKSDDSFID